MLMTMNQYLIYTDGSCKGNPGPGAAAVVITTPEGEVVREFVKAYPDTTNNRMELSAAIAALRAVPAADITVITDSEYVYKGITSWVRGWKARGWVTNQKTPVENQDLWKELDRLASSYAGKLAWKVVRGHHGTPGNERADTLAQQAAAPART